MGITIVGLGPGDISLLSKGALEELYSNKSIYMRTEKHPVIDILKKDIKYNSFDSYYEKAECFEDVYMGISKKIVELGKTDDVIYAVPGHPRVAENTVGIIENLCEKEGVNVEVIPSMSFVDAMFSFLKIDPSEGFRLIDAFEIKEVILDAADHLIITQVYDRYFASEVKLNLLEVYDEESYVYIVNGAGIKGLEDKKKVKLHELDRVENEFGYLTSLYIPKNTKHRLNFETLHKEIEKNTVVEVDDDICDYYDGMIENIQRNTEKYAQNINADNLDGIIDSLSDMLIDITCISEIGKKVGFFDINEIIKRSVEKINEKSL